MQIEHRQAGQEDFELYYGIKRLALSEHVEATWGTWDEDKQLVRAQEAFIPRFIEFITVDGDEIGLISREYDSGRLFIREFYLLPDYQRRGIGTALVKATCADSPVAVELRVLKVSPAVNLYQRLGFETYEETDTHFMMRRAADP